MGNIFKNNKDESIKDLKDKVFPFSDNDKLSKTAAKFHLEGPDIIKFHEIFRQMDKNGSGYIALENLFQFLDEELTSSLSPYIQRLFALTEKETSDKISFGEWLPALSVYCLYPSEKIYSFVFSIIDDDHDGTISKKDMIKFLVQKHYGKKIFPFNYVKAIEILEVDRSDKITFEQFKRIQSKIPFLCYPAFRLQSTLRSKVINKQFWDNLYYKIRDQESKDQKQQQQDKIQDEIQKKKNMKLENKAKNFDQYYSKRQINQGFILPVILGPREPKRRGSDGKVGLDVGNLLEINQEIRKNQKRSNSFLYVKQQIINKKKKQVQSDDENQNQHIVDSPSSHKTKFRKSQQNNNQPDHISININNHKSILKNLKQKNPRSPEATPQNNKNKHNKPKSPEMTPQNKFKKNKIKQSSDKDQDQNKKQKNQLHKKLKNSNFKVKDY